jgi:cytoskeleton-associated protein 5
MKSKNPQVKEGTLKFLGRCLASSASPVQPAQVKPLAETLATLLEDGFEGARNEAATCLGTLMKMVGERPLNVVIDGLADVRKAKVKESYEKAIVKCKSGTSPPKVAPVPKPTVKKPPGVIKSAVADEDETPPKNPVNKSPAKVPVCNLVQRLVSESVLTIHKKPKKPAAAGNTASATKKPSQPAPSKTPKPPPSQASSALDAFKYKHTPEDAEALATELLPSSVMTDLADANWKTRLAALDELTLWVEGEIDVLDAEVVIRALAKKGWGEKNFQVCFGISAKGRALILSPGFSETLRHTLSPS